MERFLKLRKVSPAKVDRNDCSVVALAITCRVSYKVAQQALIDSGRNIGERSFYGEEMNAVRKLGCTFETESPRQPNGCKYTPKTIGQYCKRGYYLAWCKGHIFAVVNGVVEDWTNGRKNHIIRVSRITVPKGSRS